jgi:hypothetical protein
MRLSKKLLIAALPLISAASAAAAQSCYRTYGVCDGLKERGYY